jgi:hypothetical protein
VHLYAFLRYSTFGSAFLLTRLIHPKLCSMGVKILPGKSREFFVFKKETLDFIHAEKFLNCQISQSI